MFDLTVNRVDLVKEGANSKAFIKLYKSKGGEQLMGLNEILASLKPEHKAVVEEALKKASEEVPTDAQEKLTSAEGMVETLKSKLATTEEELRKSKAAYDDLQKSKEDTNPEDVIKGLDPAVQEIFKSMQSQKKAAEEMIKQMNTEKVHNTAVAKAKELKALPVKEEDLITAIEKGVDPTLMSILEASAKAFSEADLFKSKGADTSGAGDSASSAWDKIEAKAEAIAKSKNITKQKAVGEAIKENPDLYKAYLEGGAN